MSNPIAYMAHPYGGSRENLESAIAWLRFLFEEVPDVDFCAPWIACCVAMPYENERFRERALMFGEQVVTRCDQLWIVGQTVSPGMEREINAAMVANIRVIDVTGFVLHISQYDLIKQTINWRLGR